MEIFKVEFYRQQQQDGLGKGVMIQVGYISYVSR